MTIRQSIIKFVLEVLYPALEFEPIKNKNHLIVYRYDEPWARYKVELGVLGNICDYNEPKTYYESDYKSIRDLFDNFIFDKDDVRRHWQKAGEFYDDETAAAYD